MWTTEQISFVGREMELHGRTASGELIKAVSRPDETVMSRGEGGKALFAFDRSEVMLFEDSETGQRLS